MKDAQAALCTYAPNIWEELHGLADGLKIPLERAAAEYSNSRLRFPSRGCSSVMTKAFYGRNYDYSPRRYDPILVAIQPKGVHASLALSDRFTGRVDGMNEHGLCVGLHFVNFKPVRPGLVCILIVRMVLDQCATTQEAVRLLTRIPHGQPFNYSVLDTTGAAAVVEASPLATSVRDGRQLACTNHFQIAKLGRYNRRNAGSHRRLRPLETWARAELSPEQLFVALNHAGSPVFDHAYRSGSGTLHTFVCEPAGGGLAQRSSLPEPALGLSKQRIQNTGISTARPSAKGTARAMRPMSCFDQTARGSIPYILMLLLRLSPSRRYASGRVFLHRYLNHPAIGEQHHGLVARLGEMATEFLQQLQLGVEHLRHAARVHRDAVDDFLIKPQQPHRELGGAEIMRT